MPQTGIVMDDVELKRVAQRLHEILSQISALSPGGVDHVEHYLGVAEIEMAYESLVLSLMGEQVVLDRRLANELLLLGVALGLDQESVFQGDFWEKAAPYLDRGSA
jgi:hypothetical protein